MAISLDNAIVYDVETFPNVFTFSFEHFKTDQRGTFEISEFQDDTRTLKDFLNWCSYNHIPMVGFNNLHFDYPIVHHIYTSNASVNDIYNKSQEIINSGNIGRKWDHQIWERDRIAPQIDLFTINHFDNRAKTTSLKALQFNMRSQTIVDMPVQVGTRLTNEQTKSMLIPYNIHDVSETKQFAKNCLTAINFRIGLTETIVGDVLNFNDTKIGEKLLEQRIGEDICYSKTWIENDYGTGGYYKKTKRQTIRSRIVLNDIIFPYIYFNNPEFIRVLSFLKQQILTPEDLGNEGDEEKVQNNQIVTKGVFKDLTAHVGGLNFHFGTGGIHASVAPQRVVSSDEWLIRDIDVKGFYPNAAIVNGVAPEHLGEAYVREYSKIPIEREEWQKRKGKKSVEANGLKLAGNGVYGKSNSPFSIFYDPQYTMTITINCQLLLCMLADWLLTVPTLKIIQANTDGITYFIHKNFEPQAAALCKQWQQYTCLVLEDADYNRMWIRDVNNYVAENKKGDLKQKGAYWHPDPLNYAQSISEQQPPAWHKDLGNCISIRAAVLSMVHGINPATIIRTHSDKFDFMLRAKVSRADFLLLGDRELQRTSRYYVAKQGETLKAIRPALGPIGQFKRSNTVSEQEYDRVMKEIGRDKWDVRIHTKNKSKYEPREAMFEAGWKVCECNNADDFRFDNLNYDYYIAEAEKLIIQ